MDGANADSDHSMTWEDFFGSTTDLTPTLIGIYDSLLEPDKSIKTELTCETAKDARNDPPVNEDVLHFEDTKNIDLNVHINQLKQKNTTKLVQNDIPVPVLNKSSLYPLNSKIELNGANNLEKSVIKTDLMKNNTLIIKDNKMQRSLKEIKSSDSAFDNLSPNVKRMISSATETTTLKIQKKSLTTARSSMRHKSNIPLVGATSKISHSGVEILPSVDVYDQPCVMNSVKQKSEESIISPTKIPVKLEFKLNDVQTTYDVPTNNRPAIYDVPISKNNKTTFESLSLPYIDQSIELSITSNDREFDTKLSSKDISPDAKNITVSEKNIDNNETISLNKESLNNNPKNETVSLIGNPKFPEKNTMKFNPPIVEVSRPLSMSSIASSSSTSSSGVQNKGGVNSAYLASIESLDDHSDADLTSTNGSNNFVNNAGMMTASASEERDLETLPRLQALDEMAGLSQLERVLTEIVQTENVYVEDLRQVVEGYLHVWRKEGTFSDSVLSELFNNIEDIYAFNKSLCAELNTCPLDPTCIAQCFVNNTAGFTIYTSYCTGYPVTMERLADLASDSKSAREFRERQVALGHPLPLASSLLKPVQRILKYHLLLQNVVKHCRSNETEYALLKMTGIAQHIDDMKRKHEHAVRVQEIQSLLYGWNGPDLTTYGELCAEGTFRVFGAKAMRHVFLFDKMLLVTKNREDGILAYKSHIMCNNMMLVESIAGAPLSFHVIPWDAPRSQLTLQASSQRHKREWTLLLKRVILENYNAVIPSHARQLVMELGQNKTDDDMLAEKSHGLITQASMRKQLSAPEYLEKRKLERERRKAFETGRQKKITRKINAPTVRDGRRQDCDCSQYSAEKGVDYTCEHCYIDLCSECELDINNQRQEKCNCPQDESTKSDAKCPECDRYLRYIDAGSAENLDRKLNCKCSDFQSSQESFNKDFISSLNITRGYHSSDNIVGYTDANKNKDIQGSNNSLLNVKCVHKSCLKCEKIKENIAVTGSSNTLRPRQARFNDKQKGDNLRSKSKEDSQRSKLSKIGGWRRKSEPGLPQNSLIIIKKSQESDTEKHENPGCEKIEFECRVCGSNKIARKNKISETVLSDPEIDGRHRNNTAKQNLEIKMYNTKHIPKKISKLKKSRAKGLRSGADTTAKFYADFSTDVSTENILHISESNDSLNVEKPVNSQILSILEPLTKDEDIDEETYKKLIEKTDSFKKNELDKVKYLNKQKVINEGTETEEKSNDLELRHENNPENLEEIEQPLEQIISQLLLQNREFQKLLKKQQLRNSAQRRHQRLLKSHSTPETVVASKIIDSPKLKHKYERHHSESNDTSNLHTHEIIENEDDHIYETLRIEDNSKLPTAEDITIKEQNKSPLSKLSENQIGVKKKNLLDSDYVYLSFDKLSQLQDHDGIYDVPLKSNQKVSSDSKPLDYYVVMDKQKMSEVDGNTENIYDNLQEVRMRSKETAKIPTSDYLPMGPDQSPNTPEIWLCRQKEHFNTSRDRKSGSLPRSFQVSNPEDTSLTSFKGKSNNNKTYLKRDGKVVSTDRPITIASDQSELSYEENYMGGGDVLKINCSNESDYAMDISQSTLELEEEIDRCYKNNFEANLDSNKNQDLLTSSQPNLNASITSSLEVLSTNIDNRQIKEIETVHPEHKIYKPNNNTMSLKNVLNRFKSNRNPTKNNENTEPNANEQNSPEKIKNDPKSPTNEKRSILNPKNYSKSLLQRFKNIISDETHEDSPNKSTITNKNIMKTEIKVIITSTETSPVSSTAVYTINTEALSKSVCDHSTLSESQNEKNNVEIMSHSLDDIAKKQQNFRPVYEKSCSTNTNISSSFGSGASLLKSSNSSFQSLNKLPSYMQGSKNLGARIAQSDYVDPSTLVSEKSSLKNINILINRNSIRPDSLFSNSSFVTSSSEGTYHDSQTKTNNNQSEVDCKSITNSSNICEDSSAPGHSDESYYEKSFELIENVIEDVFRDSAVYSDQEDGDENKTQNIITGHQNKTETKSLLQLEPLKRNLLVEPKKVTVSSSTANRSSIHTSITVSSNKTNIDRGSLSELNKSTNEKIIKPKLAPPVPVKPKITSIPTGINVYTKYSINKSSGPLHKLDKKPSTETVSKTLSTNKIANLNSCDKHETNDMSNNESKKSITHETKQETSNTSVDDSKTTSNIYLKRLSYERASLDSATRKVKTVMNHTRRSSTEPQKITTKTVMERRMEIEMISKNSSVKTNKQFLRKPVQFAKPKPMTNKVTTTFVRSVSDCVQKVAKIDEPSSFNRNKEETNIQFKKGDEPSVNVRNETSADESNVNVETNIDNDEVKGSWVKQVVNKFQ